MFLQHAGGLWRDEVVTCNVATASTIAEVWQSLKFDSFPALFHLLLRSWNFAVGGADSSLRIFGFVVGLFGLGALWIHARLMDYEFPMFSLVFIALHPGIIRFGDSMRAYGVGAAFVVLSSGLIWRMVNIPHRRRFLTGALVSVVSVSCLYSNAVLLLGIGLAGIVVAFCRRSMPSAMMIAGIGFLSALSLLIYVPVLRQLSAMQMVIPQGLRIRETARGFIAALNSNGTVIGACWIALLLVAAIGMVWTVVGRGSGAEMDKRKDIVLFAGLTIFIAIIGSFAWLKLVGIPLQLWHYLALMAVVATSLDVFFANLVAGNGYRVVRLIVVIALGGLAFTNATPSLKRRQTNIDLVALQLSKISAAGDFIIVNPWHTGATFSRYYHGNTPWTILPPLRDPTLQRLDLLKEKLGETAPIADVLERIASALKSGDRVWIVGEFPLLRPGELPPYLPPAPKTRWGWHYPPYTMAWAMQTEYFLQAHARQIESIPVPSVDPVSSRESGQLKVAIGWRD
jgi:hypothetical protein